MKKHLIILFSTLFLLTSATCSFASSKVNIKKQWSHKPIETYLQESWLYHVTKEGTAIYMMGDGEGTAKMMALNSKGAKVWDKKLESSFAIGIGTVPAIYMSENGKISKYNLNSGEKIKEITVPNINMETADLYGVSKNNTLYIIDWTLKVTEIDEQGNILSSYDEAEEITKNITIQKPNMQNGNRMPPAKIMKALKKSVPSFIKNKNSFEKKYGKGAKYYPFYVSKTKGSTVYVLAYYQINGKKIYSHSVLFKFSSTGKFLSQKDLGDYNGKDIALDSKGNVYVTLNKLSKTKPYAFVKIVDKKNKIVKEIKFNGRFIFDGKVYKDRLYIVSDKYFYMYR